MEEGQVIRSHPFAKGGGGLSTATRRRLFHRALTRMAGFLPFAESPMQVQRILAAPDLT